MHLRHTLLVSALACLAGCMSEDRFNEALANPDPTRAGADEQEILTWLAESEGDALLRYRAVETVVTMHARGKHPENDTLVSQTLRSEYQQPRLEPDSPDLAEESRRLRAWILFQSGRLKDPRWIPFLLEETAAGLALPADDGRGGSGLRGLAELIDAVAGDADTATQLLHLAAIAASRPQDPRLAQAGQLVAFIRERLSEPQRVAALIAADDEAAVHAVLVHWGAATLQQAARRGEATAPGSCDTLIAQLVAEEAGRSDARLAAMAREALAACAPLHLVQGMAARLLQTPDDRASADLAAALLIASDVQPAHPVAPASGAWANGELKLCCEPALAGAEAWAAIRSAAVQVLFSSVTALAAKPAEREKLICCLAAIAPIETAPRLAAEAPASAVEAAEHARLEQVARHLCALLAAPGVDPVGIHQALGRLVAVESEPVHRTAAATLALRDPIAYLTASAPLLERLPTVAAGLADALIDATAAALQQAPTGSDASLRDAALVRLAGVFKRTGADEDSRHDRAFACLAPRAPDLLARSLAAQLAASLAAQGPSPRVVLRAGAGLPLVRDPAHAQGEAQLIAQLAAVAARSDEQCALFATRALAEQRTTAALAALRQLGEAQPPALRAITVLAAAALADQPKP